MLKETPHHYCGHVAEKAGEHALKSLIYTLLKSTRPYGIAPGSPVAHRGVGY
jgi:hypothetical protein